MKRASLTSGPIRSQLVGLVGPMAVGMLGILIFNLVDTFFVSKLGTAELAAISLTFPVILIVGSMMMGVAIGSTSVLSRAIGGGDQSEVRRLATDALLLGLVAVALVSGLGFLSMDPLFRLLGADEETLPLVTGYMRIWYLGAIFLVVPMVGNSAIRATGDTKTPAKIMWVAGLLNAVLDPIFIFGFGPVPAMGLEGAAIATVLGRATTFVASLYVLGPRLGLITRRFDGIRQTVASWRRILVIGMPAAAGRLGQPMTVGVLTALVASHGQTAVAAFGAGGRIEMVAILPLMAIGAGMTPFIGQNWGAGQHGRVAEALRLCLTSAFGLGLVGLLILVVLARPVAGLFSKDPAVIELLVMYLRILPIAHGFLGAVGIANMAFNAVGRPLVATMVTVSRAPVLVVLFAVPGSQMFGVPGVFAGTALAAIVAGLLALLWLRPLMAEAAA